MAVSTPQGFALWGHRDTRAGRPLAGPPCKWLCLTLPLPVTMPQDTAIFGASFFKVSSLGHPLRLLAPPLRPLAPLLLHLTHPIPSPSPGESEAAASGSTGTLFGSGRNSGDRTLRLEPCRQMPLRISLALSCLHRLFLRSISAATEDGRRRWPTVY